MEHSHGDVTHTHDATPGPSGPGSGEHGVLTEIDHIGLAVEDIEATVSWYEQMFGAKVAHQERIESDGVEEALIKVADSYLQILTPYADTSPLKKWMDRNGEGIHHVGYRVASTEDVLEHCKAEGARVVDEHPRTGSRGTTVAFLHPKSSFGALIELVQE